MRKRILQALCLVFALLWIALPAGAQTGTSNFNSSVPGPPGGIHPPASFPFPLPPFDPSVTWTDKWLCRSGGPADVVGFRVQCFATFVDFHTADCCIPGDHWQLKGKIWDANPNTGVTTAPGPVPIYSVQGRAYNYSGVPGKLDAYVECSYLNGVNTFLADTFVVFSSDGACAVFPDPVVRRIDRAP